MRLGKILATALVATMMASGAALAGGTPNDALGAKGHDLPSSVTGSSRMRGHGMMHHRMMHHRMMHHRMWHHRMMRHHMIRHHMMMKHRMMHKTM